MIYIIIIVGVMVLDRIVKTAVTAGFDVGDTVPVLGDFFHITYIRNTGAAFSMLQGHPVLLIVVPAILIFCAIVYIVARYKSYKPVFMVSLSLMCGGGLGNLTDRAAYGYVIDMFDFGWFPVFNVADISVCVGCGLLLLYMIVFDRKNPEQEGETEKAGESGRAEKTGSTKKTGRKMKRLK